MNTPRTLSRPSFASNLRVIGVVAWRDWKQYWRYPLNAISSFLEPVVWLAPIFFMGLAFSINGKAQGFAAYSGTSDYMSFIIIGNAISQFIGAVFWGMGFALKNDMDSGVLESNWLAPIARPLLLVGHTLTSMVVTAITSSMILALSSLVYGLQVAGNVLQSLLALLPMLIGLYGFGFAFAALVLVTREANNMVDMSNFIVGLLSGANFPVQVLPRWLLPVSLALPLTYGFDSIRGLLLGTRTLLPIPLEIGILVASMGVLIWIGLRAFSALERRQRRMGTLGQH